MNDWLETFQYISTDLHVFPVNKKATNAFSKYFRRKFTFQKGGKNDIP